MRLDRREFLKLLGIGGAVAAVAPERLVAAPPPPPTPPAAPPTTPYCDLNAPLKDLALWEVRLEELPPLHPNCRCVTEWTASVYKPAPDPVFDAAFAEHVPVRLTIPREFGNFEGNAFVQACNHDACCFGDRGWGYVFRGYGPLEVVYK